MTKPVEIQILGKEHVTQEYVDWFKDDDILRYSNNQYKKFSFKGQLKYVEDMLASKNSDLYGIFYKKKHIGNLLISDYLNIHKRAEISYVLGKKEFWGQGIISYAISLIIDKAIKNYKLNKLVASCADKNLGSKRVLIKNGFTLEGVRKKHLFYNNKWEDQCDFGLTLNS